jgi:hypothetical protein
LNYKKKRHKCIRIKPDKIRMVVGQDVGLEAVEGLMARALVGRYPRKWRKGKLYAIGWLNSGP